MNKKRIYISSPSLWKEEQIFNEKLCDYLEENDFSVFLPQNNNGKEKKNRNKEFDNNVTGLKSCDVVISVMKYRRMDDDILVEMGMAHALGKQIIGLKTNFTFDPETLCDMVYGTMDEIAFGFKELADKLKNI